MRVHVSTVCPTFMFSSKRNSRVGCVCLHFCIDHYRFQSKEAYRNRRRIASIQLTRRAKIHLIFTLYSSNKLVSSARSSRISLAQSVFSIFISFLRRLHCDWCDCRDSHVNKLFLTTQLTAQSVINRLPCGRGDVSVCGGRVMQRQSRAEVAQRNGDYGRRCRVRAKHFIAARMCIDSERTTCNDGRRRRQRTS